MVSAVGVVGGGGGGGGRFRDDEIEGDPRQRLWLAIVIRGRASR